MPLAVALPALASAVAVASLTGDAFDAKGYPTLEIAWRLSTLSAGTASLQAQHSEDGEDWEPLGDPIALAAAGKVRGLRAGALRWVRLVLSVAGGLATFKATANALQVYASPEDLYRLALNAKSLEQVTLSDKIKALGDASDMASSCLRDAPNIDLPLSGWGGDLKRAVVNIAAYDLRSAEGYQPTKDEENSLRQRYLDALKWLALVKAGEVLLFDPDDPAGETPQEPMPEVFSDEPWGH